MKRFYTIATALLLVAGTFTSCTKDLDEVGPMSAASIDAAKPVQSGLSLAFSSATPAVGSSVTITAAFTETPTGGALKIQQATDASATDWITVKEFNLESASGPFTYDFTSSVTGVFPFRAHYVPKGGSGFSQASATGFVTFIELGCVQGMTAEVVEAEALGDNVYRLKVAFTLTTCIDYTGVKIQGGLTAHTGSVVTTGEVKELNKNFVINWEESSLAKGSKTYYVTFDKEIKGAGMVTGDWSAKTAGGIVVAETEGAYFTPAE